MLPRALLRRMNEMFPEALLQKLTRYDFAQCSTIASRFLMHILLLYLFQVSPVVGELVRDIRKLMSPYTANNLREKR